MNNKYKTIFILVSLIIVFILVSYMLKPNSEDRYDKEDYDGENPVNDQEPIKEVKKTCEETCNTDNCLYGCYSTLINVAIAEKNILSCEKINTEKIKISCLDDVNLALHNCDKIIDKELKEVCAG